MVNEGLSSRCAQARAAARVRTPPFVPLRALAAALAVPRVCAGTGPPLRLGAQAALYVAPHRLLCRAPVCALQPIVQSPRLCSAPVCASHCPPRLSLCSAPDTSLSESASCACKPAPTTTRSRRVVVQCFTLQCDGHGAVTDDAIAARRTSRTCALRGVPAGHDNHCTLNPKPCTHGAPET